MGTPRLQQKRKVTTMTTRLARRRTTAPRASAARPKVQYIYIFGAGKADGRADMKALLGGKGANLAEMTNLGVPVPPGLTITTEACRTKRSSATGSP